MHEVEGPGIEGQLLERLRIEVGLVKQIRRRLREDLDRSGHQFPVPTVGHAGPCHEQRHGTNSLVRVGRGEPTVLEHGHRPPADVVVEPVDRHRHEPLVVRTRRIDRAQLRQQFPGRSHQPEGPLDRPGRLMLEQIGMVVAVGRQQFAEQQPDHASGLAGIAEGRLCGLELVQLSGQRLGEAERRVGPFHHGPIGGLRLEPGEQFARRPPGGRIESA